ncbi:MAG: hypothetical protein CVU90_09320 [Firmicutes bacterium HGW-Firmicutes-15]|nr:MAG: hypothetical protein CVU90_09320 [Firmicutes bacterium HGW-Firmicutes-15]
MSETKNFKLNFLRQEQHLMLPTLTSIVLTQNLYDVLFQYLVTEEKEAQLKKIIDMLEKHIKRKDQAPFSMPIASLEFLDEGLEELRMLNWMEIPVAVFQISLDDNIEEDAYEDELEKILNWMENLMIFSRPEQNDLIWVYPFHLVR